MDNLKSLVGDASTYLSRAVQDAHIGEEASTMYNRARQFTEEKMGKAERTENDPVFEGLASKTDKTKNYTEKMVKNSEAVLVPNPAARLETFMFDNVPMDKIGLKDTRLTNLEYLGNDMIEAGNEFGPATPYGAALIRVGQTEQTLGEHERNYIRGGHEAMIAPLQRFLETEMKNIMRERKILENKRLDLDVCKNKVRKARAMQLQPPSEAELRMAQAEYDKQVEITKLLMEGLSSIQTNHLRHLAEFVEKQTEYYAECHAAMQDLKRELSSTTHMTPGQTSTPILRSTLNSAQGQGQGLGQVQIQGQPEAFTNGNSAPGGMEHVNLASPPPPTTNMSSLKKAEFY